MDDVKIGEILGPETEKERGQNERRVQKGFWPKVQKYARRVPFIDEVVAAYFCAMDPDTPNTVRVTLLAALGYFVLPLDSLPDFLFGFGLTDDIAVLTAALTAVRGNITEAHKAAAHKVLREQDETESDMDQPNTIDA
ncbi:MAG: YkvA family protein [Pseudomonadota bacterium]